MRIMMTGGGTGGHIYPAIAIADKIKEQHPSSEILFVGSRRGLEKSIVPEHGYPIELITVAGFDRKHPLKNIQVLKKLHQGNREVKKIIKTFKPELVIGTGGYVCGPAVRAAGKAGIKTYIHEQNAFPGMTNKLLEKYVEKVFLGFESAGPYFKQKEKHVISGNPVRKEFFQADKEASRKELGFAKDDFVLLAFGGSQGASRINKAMLGVIEAMNGIKKTQICLGTGNRYYDAILKELGEGKFKLKHNIHVLKYIEHMDQYLSAADLVISRSGALTVVEITVCGKASIFIPSPIVTGNHQYYNAKSIADRGGAILLNEDDLDSDRLVLEVLNLKNNPEVLAKMSRCSRECAPRDAAEIICTQLPLQ